MGDDLLITVFVVIIIGGIGSIRGAFIAAVLVGLLDTLGRAVTTDILRLFFDPSTANQIGPALSSMLIYILMAVVLFFKPEGLFPARRCRVMPVAKVCTLSFNTSKSFSHRVWFRDPGCTGSDALLGRGFWWQLCGLTGDEGDDFCYCQPVVEPAHWIWGNGQLWPCGVFGIGLVCDRDCHHRRDDGCHLYPADGFGGLGPFRAGNRRDQSADVWGLFHYDYPCLWANAVFHPVFTGPLWGR